MPAVKHAQPVLLAVALSLNPINKKKEKKVHDVNRLAGSVCRGMPYLFVHLLDIQPSAML